MNAGVSGSFGALGGLLGVLANTVYQKPEDPKPPNLADDVRDWFTAFESALQDTLDDALGKGDQRNLPAHLLTGQALWPDHQIAQFFDEGKWLVGDVAHSLDAIIADSKIRFVSTPPSSNSRMQHCEKGKK
jgi:hypothetical protein